MADRAHLESIVSAAVSQKPGLKLYGHLLLQREERQVELLLGSQAFLDGRTPVIDWRAAPLAEVFFAYGEGEHYEVELEGRVVSGRVLQRNLISVGADGSVQIDRPDATRVMPRESMTPFRSPLEVTLDAAQQAVVERPPQQSVLVLGEAGFGKTTVALHRLVALRAKFGRAFRAAVVVPTEGLRRLSSLMLERAGVDGVEVHTYDRWAHEVTRRAFRGIPRRESEGASGLVVRMKRHAALEPVLAEFARERPRPSRIDDDHPVARGQHASRADLLHFFGDTVWTERVVAGSHGTLPASVVSQVADHTRVQFTETSEMAYGHVDSERMQAIDGKRLDEGTPFGDADTIDAEDYAVLFELDRLRAEAHRDLPARPGRFDCVVIDEAQELAPLELKLIGRAISKQGTLIVAGDAAQQVDPTTSFDGWDGVMRSLGQPQAHRALLEVSYRCPPDVTALARHVLDASRPVAAVEPTILRALHPSPFHQAVWLTEALRELEAADTRGSICVVCRADSGARALYQQLIRGVACRLALKGELDFKPGITVTCVAEVKGLEFDYVVVPDADARTYSLSPDSQRALYVAVTRATHRLVLAAAGEWSPLV